jgi:hypothetical protein
VALVALGIALVATAVAAGGPQATSIKVQTALNAAQEVPAPTGDVDGARGTFTATLTKSAGGATMRWRLSFSGLTGPAAAAHVHLARTGQPGPVAVPLCGPCSSPASGTASVSGAALAALANGGAYVNVHTATNGAGEIRGQVGVTANVTTALNARQERPRPQGNVARARGTFTATVTKSGTTGNLAWRLRFSGLTGPAVAAHVHIGKRGVAGPVAVPLCGPCRNGARGTARLNARALKALEAGRAYVNVHTATNQAGEIRGQVRPVALRIS